MHYTEPGVAEIESMKSLPLISMGVGLVPERESGHILSRSNSLICFHMHQIADTLPHFCEETKPNQPTKIFLSLFINSLNGLMYFCSKICIFLQKVWCKMPHSNIMTQRYSADHHGRAHGKGMVPAFMLHQYKLQYIFQSQCLTNGRQLCPSLLSLAIKIRVGLYLCVVNRMKCSYYNLAAGL